MPNSYKWETAIPNRLPALMRAIEGFDHWLDQCGADDNARYLAQLAVEEIGTNIIKYGYDDQNEHAIRLSAVAEERVLRIVIEDDGHPFNPCTAPEPDPNLPLEQRKPGGWGISLIRRLLAGMEYKREGGRNVLCVLVPRDSVSQ